MISADNPANPATVNRFAVILTPTEAFLDWVNSISADDKLTIEELCEDTAVYLVPEDDLEPEIYIKKHFTALFESELEGWCTDDSLWPRDRSYKVFKRFFNISIHSVVIDLGVEDLAREQE